MPAAVAPTAEVQAQAWVTFLSDYGLDDVFVGVCKGVMAKIAPQVRILDVCHLVAPQDVVQAATVLASAIEYLPPGVHLALVDPMVEQPVRGVAVRAADGSYFVAPDNGVASMAWQAVGGAVEARVVANEDLWSPAPSRSFRGRDIFAPVAAHLAAGTPLADVGPALPVAELTTIELRSAVVDDDHVHAEVLSVDHFGNLALNCHRTDLEAAGITLGDDVEIRCQGRSQVVPFVLSAGEVHGGRLAVCENSFRAVMLAVNRGHASRELRIGRGDPVVIARAPQHA